MAKNKQTQVTIDFADAAVAAAALIGQGGKEQEKIANRIIDAMKDATGMRRYLHKSEQA